MHLIDAADTLSKARILLDGAAQVAATTRVSDFEGEYGRQCLMETFQETAEVIL